MLRPKVVSTLIDLATTLVLIGAGYILIPTLWRQEHAPGNPERLEGLTGRRIDSLVVRSRGGDSVISMRGRRSLIYVFTTTCPYCNAQKLHIQEFLGTLRDVEAIAVSGEPPSLLMGYWQLPEDSDGTPPRTFSISSASVVSLEAFSVPRFYLIERDGKITAAYSGSVMALNVPALKELLDVN